MENTHVKLSRKLGFWAAIGGSVGLVISGTAMVSVGSVAGIAGSGAWLPAFISLIPMMAVAAAYGELTAMFPGGGMISDYTMPALGKFWSIFAILSGYILLIACDGGTQQIVGALAIERITGVPFLISATVMLIVVVCINLFGVGLYGSVEIVLTMIMMVIFFFVSLAGLLGFGEAAGVATVVNEFRPFEPENGWNAAAMCAGTAIWWYIGFEFICPMAEENKKPYKNIPYGLLIGLVAIFITDMIFTTAASKYTDLNVLANSSTPQIDGALAMCGNVGFVIMTAITIIAAFTSAIAHMAALPRMLYGMAHRKLAPKCFAYVHPKFRTPWVGIFFTTGLMVITIVYMAFNGTDASLMITLINIACCTYLLSYAIAVIDVLIYRKKYPDFPRLWKTPFCTPVMISGLIGIAYCLWTMRYVWTIGIIGSIIFALYGIVWLKYKKIPLTEKEPIEGIILNIMERSEELPEWDEAVTKWMKDKQLI